MKAKINFMSKEVGQHENVLAFMGAVVDESGSRNLSLKLYFK